MGAAGMGQATLLPPAPQNSRDKRLHFRIKSDTQAKKHPQHEFRLKAPQHPATALTYPDLKAVRP